MTAATSVERRPATWEQYLALGEDLRAEYIDGEIMMSPSPGRRHQTMVRRLANVIEPALPDGYAVTTEWAWKPGGDEFVPDVMVHPATAEQVRFTGTPLLCVEVLSTKRASDYVTKVYKYAAAGLSHYWIVDPAGPSIDVLVLDGDHYTLLRTVTIEDDPVELAVGSVGSVVIDLGQLTT